MGAGMITGSGHTRSDMESERTSAKGSHIKEAMISKRDMPMMGSGGQMGSGEMMNNEMKGLHMAIRQLSPADHIALVKMIKEYLVSKGIDPAKYADMRDDIKELRKDVRTEVKDMRGTTHDAIKLKQEEMRAKVKALRSSGKVNVQDISMMKSSGGNGKVNIHDISVTK